MVKNFLCGICIILFLTSSVWAQEVNPAKVEVLTKTSSSWDGRDLPNYPTGKPEITILRIKIPDRYGLAQRPAPVCSPYLDL